MRLLQPVFFSPHPRKAESSDHVEGVQHLLACALLRAALELRSQGVNQGQRALPFCAIFRFRRFHVALPSRCQHLFALLRFPDQPVKFGPHAFAEPEYPLFQPVSIFRVFAHVGTQKTFLAR